MDNPEQRINKLGNILLLAMPGILTFACGTMIDQYFPMVSNLSPFASAIAMGLANLFGKKKFEPPYQSPGTRTIAETGTKINTTISTLLKIAGGALGGLAIRHYLPTVAALVN